MQEFSLEITKWLTIARIRGISHPNLLLWGQLCVDRDLESSIEYLKELYNRSTNNKKTLKIPSKHEVESEYEKTIAHGAKFVHFGQQGYPELLQECPMPPILMTIKGDLSLLGKKCFSIIGSRSPSLNSINLTHDIASKISMAGFVVVAGLAYGIDAQAHRSSLQHAGTIGVIGSGINRVYPLENTDLYRKMESHNGLVISEFAYDEPPMPHHFPQRNRIIAGLSCGILLIEGKKNSGSMITIRYADSFNREIYVVPGFPGDVRYEGNNYLLKKQIGKLIDCAEDILNDMEGANPQLYTVREKKVRIKEQNFSGTHSSLSPEQIAEFKEDIFNKISATPISIEQISLFLGIPISIVKISILELEISGKVSLDYGGMVFRVLEY